jgi:cyanophycinase
MFRLPVIAAALLSLCLPGALAAQGALVIVGGGLSDDNDQVFGAFIAALPSPDAPIAILPAASGVPTESAAAFADNLRKRGVAAERIRLVQIAMVDDPSTAVDESTWRNGAERPEEIAKIADVGGIWFTGGDQARIAAALLRSDGAETPMLAAIRTRLQQGSVIGGTSAGAAIMSRTMILQGDVLHGVAGMERRTEAVRTGPGLGFLDRYLVDQHFGERARLGRLALALGSIAADQRVGFGIDEDTALLVSPGHATAQVYGRGHVTIIDARQAEIATGQKWSVRGARISILSHGDSIDLNMATARPSGTISKDLPDKAADKPMCISAPSAGLSAERESSQILELTDDMRTGDTATCLLQAGKHGIAYRFGWTPDSQRWSGQASDSPKADAITGVRFDALPVSIKWKEIAVEQH